MANIYSLNPGISLQHVIPESIYKDSEKFIDFLKAYYEWLHTSEITFESVTGTFVQNEIIIGQTSKSTATISHIKSLNNVVVFVTSEKPFENGELIVGQTSGATGNLLSIKDNVYRQSDLLLSYRDVDKSVDQFSEYLKDELYAGIPKNFVGDKRTLAKKIKDYYQSKGQEQSLRFLMKVLFDQDIELYYPNEDILKVSDGKYSKKTIIRAAIIGSDADDTIFNFLFKTIRGETSGSIAKVISIKKIYVGSIYLAEMELSNISGIFTAGEEIFDISNEDFRTTLYGMVSGYNIVYGGSGYQTGELFYVSGDGQESLYKVVETYTSGIDAIKLNVTGHGYRVGAQATINNLNTGGANLAIIVSEIKDPYVVSDGSNNYTVGEITKVKVVNKGEGYYKEPTVVMRDDTIYNIGLLTAKYIQITNPGVNYTPGDWLTITPTGGIGAGANAEVASVATNGAIDASFASIKLESGDVLIAEQRNDSLKLEFWYNLGPISRITMTNYGISYNANSFPFTVSVNNSTANVGVGAVLTVTNLQGAGANVTVDTANNSGGIGSVKKLEPINFGVDYSNATISTVGIGGENANIVPSISGSATYDGSFTNDDGKVNYKKIQDSYFYQQYSYVIKSGIEISKYRTILKKLIHPAGLEVFGEIQLLNSLNLRMASDSVNTVDSISNILIRLISSSDSNLLVKKVLDFEVSGDLDTFGEATFNTVIPESGGAIFANTPLLPYRYYSFLSPFGVSNYIEVEKNIRIAGSANVTNKTIVGTGTSFTDYFSGGDSFVVIDRTNGKQNRFDIESVANNTFMTLRVAPPSSMTNAEVYYLII
jgi:hypothetical protein